MSAYSHIFDACDRTQRITIDPFKGRDGNWGLSLVVGDKYFFVPRKDDWDEFIQELLSVRAQIGVWDVRRILDFPLTTTRLIWDIKSLSTMGTSLPSAVQTATKTSAHPAFAKYLEADQRVIAHARALKTTKINIPVAQAIPVNLLTDWMKARTSATHELWGKFLKGPLVEDYEGRWPFILSLHQVELNGIHVDLSFVESQLNSTLDPATGKALRSIQGLCKNGYVTSLVNPMGAKTGRVRPEGGFNSLGIPHGPARTAITSRYEGGLIYTFDFNAIDYRCIINSIGGEMAKLYAGAQDFHERTTSFIFKEVSPARRKNIKFLSYIYIYGGSEETLIEKTGWAKENIRAVLDILDKKIGPVKEFRERLWMQAQETRQIQVPGGRIVEVDDEDFSPGKAIGLYAQTFSTWVFERAFTMAQKTLKNAKSKVIFEVHDELVIDAHPDEFELMEEVRKIMEYDGHVVKMKKGRSYGEVE